MRPHRRTDAAGTGQGSFWPVLLVLLAAVLVPTACVVWFMTEAMANEALAVRQRLRDVYSEKIVAVREALDRDCGQRLNRLSEGHDLPAGQRFSLLASGSGADSVIVCEKAGRVLYPSDAALPVHNSSAPAGGSDAQAPATASDAGGNGTDPAGEDSAWQAVSRIEQDTDLLAQAAQAYADLAERASDPVRKALALQGQVRCLMRLDHKAALRVLGTLLADEHLRQAADPSGRLIGPAAQLLELQLLTDRQATEFAQGTTRLRDRLLDYRGQPMPASQRRFLLRALEEIAPNGPALPVRAAEDMAAQYLEMEQPPAEPGALTTTRIAGLWQVATPDRTVIALYRLDPLLRQWQDLARTHASTGMMLALRPPQANAAGPEAFLSAPAGEHLPGWALEVQLEGADPAAAVSRKALYLWTGGAGVTFIAVLALAAGGFVGRQMRLTRLKNDLIATVSHELKTPLASMRMLVDTLLEGRYRDDRQVHEYLQLIARENLRLCRLIDNFLTFSRMERNKKAFDFRDVHVQDIMSAAVEAVQDRFMAPGCRLEVQVEPNLPAVLGDRDALVTALLNLLDNAYKYTRDDKHVCLRGFAEHGQVVLEVADNGIGIPRRAQRRIFDRFYQVDQSLSRKAGGCGLGLSIVQFIVAAHGGTISVISEPAKGSRFALRLPALDNKAIG